MYICKIVHHEENINLFTYGYKNKGKWLLINIFIFKNLP